MVRAAGCTGLKVVIYRENLEPEEREAAWIPTRFNSLREVPAYQNFIREAFNRCAHQRFSPHCCQLSGSVPVSSCA